MGKKRDDQKPRRRLSGEGLESRILLSATWVGTDGDDTHEGSAADEVLDAGLGDDIVASLGGDDVVDGGEGNDTIDYSAAESGVTVDLTVTTGQDVGGGQGIDTLQNIENVRGSEHDDVFRFSEPADGAKYGVDGNGGSNTVDLSGFSSSSVSFSDGAVQVDLEDGGSFSVEFENVESFTFSDRSMDIVTWDGHRGPPDWSDASNWSSGEVPGPDDIVVIGDGAPRSLAIGSSDGPTQLGGLIVQDDYGSSIRVTGDLDIDGDLVIGSGSLDANDHTINLSGDLVVESGATLKEDTADFVFDGAGEQVVRGEGLELHSIEIDKEGGSVVLGSDVECESDFVVRNGGFDQDGHLLELQGQDTTIDAEGVTFGDLKINTSGTTTFTHDVVVDGDLTIDAAQRLDGGQLQVTGNVTANDSGWYGSAEVVLNGAGDQMITTDGSGELHDLTIDKASGTVTLGNTLEVSGDLTIANGTFDPAGHLLELQGQSTTIDAEGVTFGDLKINTSGTTTFTHDVVVDGDLAIDAAQRLDGGQLQVTGNVTANDSGWYGSAEVVLNGAGDQMITTDGSGELHDLTIDKASGTVTLGNTLEVSGDLTIANGTFDPAGHLLELQGQSTTIDAEGVTFGDLKINTSGTTTFTHDVVVDGDLTIDAAQRLDGGQLQVTGNVTANDRGWYGSSEVVLNGAGDQVITTDGSGELHDLTIDKASGTVTLGNDLEISGDLTIGNGTFDQDGHLLELQGQDTTIDAEGVTFGDLKINTSGTTTFTHDVVVDGDLTIDAAQRLDGGQLQVTGNVTANDRGWYGSSEVVLNGAGDQVITTDGSGELHDLTIDKASGTVTLGNDLEISGDLTIGNGTFDQDGHLLELQGQDTTIDAEGVTFGDLRINTSGTTTFTHDVVVDGDLTIDAAQRLDGGQLQVTGNVTANDRGWYGSSEVVLNGAGDQVITTDGSGELHDLTIDKASGTVTLGNTLEVSGDLTIANGTFDQDGHLLELQGQDTTIDAEGVTFGDLKINTSGTTTFTHDVVVDGDLTIDAAQRLDGGQLQVTGNVTANDRGWYGSSEVVLNGAGDQMITTDGSGELHDLTIDKASGTVTLGNTLEVSGDLTIANGTFDPAGHLLELQGQSTTIDAEGVTFGDLRINTSGTTTFTHDVVVDGDLTIDAAQRLDGGQLQVTGNVTANDRGWYGSSEVVLNGAGDQVITTDGSGELHDLTIDKASGTVTLGNDLEISGDLTIGNGTFEQAGHMLEFQGSDTTIDVGDQALGDVTFNVSGTTTLAGDVVVGGDLTVNGLSRLEGGTIYVLGELNGSDSNWSGAGEIVQGAPPTPEPAPEPEPEETPEPESSDPEPETEEAPAPESSDPEPEPEETPAPESSDPEPEPEEAPAPESSDPGPEPEETSEPQGEPQPEAEPEPAIDAGALAGESTRSPDLAVAESVLGADFVETGLGATAAGPALEGAPVASVGRDGGDLAAAASAPAAAAAAAVGTTPVADDAPDVAPSDSGPRADGLAAVMQNESAAQQGEPRSDSGQANAGSRLRGEPDGLPDAGLQGDTAADVEPERDASDNASRSWLGNAWASLLTLLKGQRTGDERDGR